SLRRSASEPFSTSSLRAILSMVMGFGSPSVRVGKPNQPESNHDRPRLGAGAVDGSSYVGLNPPTAPTVVLHHYRGHQRDTEVGTIEEQYHVDFGARSDMHLDTLLEREG